MIQANPLDILLSVIIFFFDIVIKFLILKYIRDYGMIKIVGFAFKGHISNSP